MNISIIVPVLNEAAIIRGFLQHLRTTAPDAEIIVADGGFGCTAGAGLVRQATRL